MDPSHDRTEPGAVTRPTPVNAGALASLGAAVLWAALAGWRPGVTLHLAPVIVVGIAPYVAWSRSPGNHRVGVVASAVLGGGIAALTVATLAAAGWLEGPTWFASDASREALILAATATAVSLPVGRLASQPRPPH